MTIFKLKGVALCAAVLMCCGAASAAEKNEKNLMHCFAWTSVKEATQADWDAFFKASDELPKKIKGIERVWYGKLLSPLSQVSLAQPDREAFQKYQAGETVVMPVRRAAREWGMCIEMKDENALKAYADAPYHKIWNDAYAKIRVDGTTTFNILGQ